MVFNAFLGVGATADAFGFATRIPNVLQTLLGEGSLSASFIPVYSAELERDEEEAGRIAGAVAALLAVAAAVLVVLGVVFARQITTLLLAFSGGSDDPRFELTVRLLQIIFPSTGLLVLSAWCLGILNSHRQFFLSYVAPVLWNVAQITTVVGAAWLFPFDVVTTVFSDGILTTGPLSDPAVNISVLDEVAEVAAWGFLGGSALQFLVQVPSVLRLVKGLRVRIDTSREGVREVLRRFVGAVSGRGVVQLSAFADTILAGALTIGAVGALVNAQILYILPISLFAMSVAAAELPELSRLAGNDEEIRRRNVRGSEQIAFFVAFSALAYILLGDRIVGALFERGEFNSDDTLLVWFTLGAYALGLVPSSLSRLTMNTVWAHGDTAGPARIAVARVAVSIVVAVAAMQLFDTISTSDIRSTVPTLFDGGHSDDSLRFGAMGITLGSAVAAWLEFALLTRLASTHVRDLRPLRAMGPLITPLVSAAIVAIAMRVATDDMWPPLAALLAVGFSGLSYVGAAILLRVDAAQAVLVGPLKRLRW